MVVALYVQWKNYLNGLTSASNRTWMDLSSGVSGGIARVMLNLGERAEVVCAVHHMPGTTLRRQIESMQCRRLLCA